MLCVALRAVPRSLLADELTCTDALPIANLECFRRVAGGRLFQKAAAGAGFPHLTYYRTAVAKTLDLFPVAG